MNNLQICPPHLSDDVATLPWEIPKSHFSTLLFIYFRLFTLPHKKTNCNCCTAALSVYLLLFSASHYLHSPSNACGARYRRSACIDIDVLRLAAAVCCDIGLNFSTAWCTTRLNCVEKDWKHINAEGGHCEHLLWHCLPNSPVATHHNQFFSEPSTTTQNWLYSEPPTFERTQQTFSQVKKFCISQVSVVTF